MWTCPNCSVAVKFPATSPAIHCVCGLVYHRAGDCIDRSRVREPGQARRVPRRSSGPGTELRKILGRCSCSYAQQLDEWGPDGCLERINEIVCMMRDDAMARGESLGEDSANRMIRLAIERSRAGTDGDRKSAAQ